MLEGYVILFPACTLTSRLVLSRRGEDPSSYNLITGRDFSFWSHLSFPRVRHPSSRSNSLQGDWREGWS